MQLLKKLKTAQQPVSVPGYSRKIEDVVPDAMTIAANVPILIVEGNYLLLDTPPWDEIADLLDLSYFLHVPADLTRARLLKRHAEHGRFEPDWIERHVTEVDMVNYDVVEASAPRADVYVELDTET